MASREVCDVLSRTLVLSPDPVAPGRARQLVRQTLRDADRTDWIDAAELGVSELVTNAALHARTAVELNIAVRTREVRVEVRDYNPVLPRQRHYGEHATTGRGMALVAAVSSSCGVTACRTARSPGSCSRPR